MSWILADRSLKTKLTVGGRYQRHRERGKVRATRGRKWAGRRVEFLGRPVGSVSGPTGLATVCFPFFFMYKNLFMFEFV